MPIVDYYCDKDEIPFHGGFRPMLVSTFVRQALRYNNVSSNAVLK